MTLSTITDWLSARECIIICFTGIPTGDWYGFLYRSGGLLFNLFICLVGAGKGGKRVYDVSKNISNGHTLVPEVLVLPYQPRPQAPVRAWGLRRAALKAHCRNCIEIIDNNNYMVHCRIINYVYERE